MIRTPIVFSFDDNYTIPSGVCITSLLENALPETFYDIFIMHSSKRLCDANKEKIIKLKDNYTNCDFTFIDLKDSFEGAFEIRDISIDAYYRLAIPEKILQYDRIIYSDVDVIFNGDLSHLNAYNLNNASLGVIKVPPFDKILNKNIYKLGLKVETYFNSGFLLMDLKKIRNENSIEKKVLPLKERKLKYQDQDILNIAYQNDVVFMDDTYCYTFNRLQAGINIEKPYIYHYSGKKPWDIIRSFGDIWWEYYRKSIFFDQNKYLDYQNKKFSELSNYYKVGNFLMKIGIFQLLKSFMKNK